jgi:hypothetical protein
MPNRELDSQHATRFLGYNRQNSEQILLNQILELWEVEKQHKLVSENQLFGLT